MTRSYSHEPVVREVRSTATAARHKGDPLASLTPVRMTNEREPIVRKGEVIHKVEPASPPVTSASETLQPSRKAQAKSKLGKAFGGLFRFGSKNEDR